VAWTESRGERKLLEIVRAAGLPQPRCNVLVEGERVDAVWERQRVMEAEIREALIGSAPPNRGAAPA
jgi:hypothetical protein